MWLFTLMKVCFITNQRYVHSLKSGTLYTSHQNNRGRTTQDGRHLNIPSFGLHGGSSEERCGYSAPGSVIHSDMWAAYRRVQHLPPVAVHNTVNHSLNFVDPVTGVHTQNIESDWKRVKMKLKRMKGCHAHQLASYLDEFMWRERHGTTYSDALTNIVRDITQCESVSNSIQIPLNSMLISNAHYVIRSL